MLKVSVQLCATWCCRPRRALHSGAGDPYVAYALAGFQFFKEEKPAFSQACLLEAIRLKPEGDASVFATLGALSRASSNTDLAVTLFNKSLSIRPDHNIAVNGCGVLSVFMIMC